MQLSFTWKYNINTKLHVKIISIETFITACHVLQSKNSNYQNNVQSYIMQIHAPYILTQNVTADPNHLLTSG